MTGPQTALDFSEAEKGHEEVARLAELRADYLERIRRRMRILYFERVALWGEERAHVTPDDARRAFEAMHPPSGEELNRNFLAAVFQPREWVVLELRGHVSRTAGSHGNRLNTYRFVER